MNIVGKWKDSHCLKDRSGQEPSQELLKGKIILSSQFMNHLVGNSALDQWFPKWVIHTQGVLKVIHCNMDRKY